MKPNESIEDFSNRFLHPCYEFHEEDMDLDFFKQKFEWLVHISFHDESETLDISSSPTFVNNQKPLILEEESTIHFVPCHPPFSILMWVPPCGDVEVGEYENKIVDLSLQTFIHFS